jgi:response regulator of citrate/malate metabolism
MNEFGILTDKIYNLLQKREQIMQKLTLDQMELDQINENIAELYQKREQYNQSGVRNRTFESNFKAREIAQIIDI